MSDKLKNIVVVVSFSLIIFGFFFLNLISPDKDISTSERRNLKLFPKFDLKKVINGEFFKEFDEYSMDQFYRREDFRNLKIKLDLLTLGNYKEMSIYNSYIYEILYPLNEKSVLNLTSKINKIKELYLNDSNKIYFSLIPDKNYYIENSLKLNYDKMVSLYKNNVSGEYIDLFKVLNLDDYYKSDTHWKEERLEKVAEKLGKVLEVTLDNNYNLEEVTEFNGVYGSRLILKGELDKIVTVHNEYIDEALVTDLVTNKQMNIYDKKKISSLDKYDIYLDGANSLIKIFNPLSNNNRKLIIFRDSYSSSLAPLLISGYQEIILVDTRYISPKILRNYIDFNGADILFLYGVLMANDSYSIR